MNSQQSKIRATNVIPASKPRIPANSSHAPTPDSWYNSAASPRNSVSSRQQNTAQTTAQNPNFSDRSAIATHYENADTPTRRPSIIRARDLPSRNGSDNSKPESPLLHNSQSIYSAQTRAVSSNAHHFNYTPHNPSPSHQQTPLRSISSLKNQTFPAINENIPTNHTPINNNINNLTYQTNSPRNHRPMSMQQFSANPTSDHLKNQANLGLTGPYQPPNRTRPDSSVRSASRNAQQAQRSASSLYKNLAGLNINTTSAQTSFYNSGTTNSPIRSACPDNASNPSAMDKRQTPSQSGFYSSQSFYRSVSRNGNQETLNTSFSNSANAHPQQILDNDKVGLIKQKLLKSKTIHNPDHHAQSQPPNVTEAQQNIDTQLNTSNKAFFRSASQSNTHKDSIPFIEEFQSKYSSNININHTSRLEPYEPNAAGKFSSTDSIHYTDRSNVLTSPTHTNSSQRVSRMSNYVDSNISNHSTHQNSDLNYQNDSTSSRNNQNTFQLGEESMEAAEARVGRKIMDLEISKNSLLALNNNLEIQLKNQLKYVSHLEDKLKKQPEKHIYVYSDDSADQDPDEVFENAVKDDIKFQKLLSTIEGLIKETQDAIEYKSNSVAKVISSVKYDINQEKASRRSVLPGKNNTKDIEDANLDVDLGLDFDVDAGISYSDSLSMDIDDKSSQYSLENSDNHLSSTNSYPVEFVSLLKKEKNQLEAKLCMCRELVEKLALSSNSFTDHDHDHDGSSGQHSPFNGSEKTVFEQKMSPTKKLPLGKPKSLFQIRPSVNNTDLRDKRAGMGRLSSSAKPQITGSSDNLLNIGHNKTSKTTIAAMSMARSKPNLAPGFKSSVTPPEKKRMRTNNLGQQGTAASVVFQHKNGNENQHHEQGNIANSQLILTQLQNLFA